MFNIYNYVVTMVNPSYIIQYTDQACRRMIESELSPVWPPAISADIHRDPELFRNWMLNLNLPPSHNTRSPILDVMV